MKIQRERDTQIACRQKDIEKDKQGDSQSDRHIVSSKVRQKEIQTE